MRYWRSTLTIFIQFIVLALLLGLLAPLLIKGHTTFTQTQYFFQIHHRYFLISHLLFYGLLYGLWPRLIQCLASSQTIPLQQLTIALQARYYLIGLLIALELLMVWR